MSIDPQIHEILLLQNLTLKYKVKVMGEVKVQIHNVGPTSHRLTFFSFHFNWPRHSLFSGFRDMGSTSLHPSAAWFETFLAHGQAHMGQMGKWLWCCTNYRSRQYHRTSNGANPSSGFCYLTSAKSGRPPPVGRRRQYPSSPEGWGVKSGRPMTMGDWISFCLQSWHKTWQRNSNRVTVFLWYCLQMIPLSLINALTCRGPSLRVSKYFLICAAGKLVTI